MGATLSKSKNDNLFNIRIILDLIYKTVSFKFREGELVWGSARELVGCAHVAEKWKNGKPTESPC